jgi:DNA invertase Pin-like site-specific DNA recombinase
MTNAVIYARYSSAGQNEQSIEAQTRICKEFGESKGFNIVNIYADKARTGINDDRPAFQKMIADAKSGAFQCVIVYMFDRFARNRRDSIMYKELLKEKYSIKVLSALEPVSDDEGGEFYEMFLEWNAEKYSKRLSKRVKDGIDTSVANGTYCGGYIVYGYKINLEPVAGKSNKFIKTVLINDAEAEVVKYIFGEYDKGTPKVKIANDLNAKGCRIKGKQFSPKIFDTWLRLEKYTGEFKFGGRQCTNMYPQIIDKALFMRVQERLDSNKYFIGGALTARVNYLLSGKVFCGHCGDSMVGDGSTSKSGVKHYYYTCKQKKKDKCNKRRENKKNLENYVVENVRAFLDDKKNAEVAVRDTLKFYEKRTDEESLKSIEAKIVQAKREIEEITDSFIKAKSELLRTTIEKKMTEYEILFDDLLTQKSKLELERGYRITQEDLVDFIADILTGDPTREEYQQSVIDNLVNRVVVSDDNTIVVLRFGGNKLIKSDEMFDISDFNGVISQLGCATATSSPLPNQY